jgi:hypothetical protein
VVHHRDDTEEVRKYNTEHYERWGCNEDGTFEYGKYVVFMTQAEHNKHHKTGAQHTAETRAQIGASLKGRHVSDETRKKLSESRSGDKNPMYGLQWPVERKERSSQVHKKLMQGIKFIYKVYKENSGQLNWNEFQKALKSSDITFEIQPISIFINGDK